MKLWAWRIGVSLWYVLVVLALGWVVIGCVTTSTAPSPADALTSPTGMFRFDAGDYGPPTYNHGIYAEDRWHVVEQCTGLTHTPRGFKIILRANAGGATVAYFMSSGIMVGGRYHPMQSVEVFGDPVWVQSWKHEFLHHLLAVTKGDPDANHLREEWLRCTTF